MPGTCVLHQTLCMLDDPAIDQVWLPSPCFSDMVSHWDSRACQIGYVGRPMGQGFASLHLPSAGIINTCHPTRLVLCACVFTCVGGCAIVFACMLLCCVSVQCMFTCVCTCAHVELMSDVFLDRSPRISIEAGALAEPGVYRFSYSS